MVRTNDCQSLDQGGSLGKLEIINAAVVRLILKDHSCSRLCSHIQTLMCDIYVCIRRLFTYLLKDMHTQKCMREDSTHTYRINQVLLGVRYVDLILYSLDTYRSSSLALRARPWMMTWIIDWTGSSWIERNLLSRLVSNTPCTFCSYVRPAIITSWRNANN